MVWFGQPVLDSIYFADHVKAHLPRVCCVPVARLLDELNAVVSQDRVDAIGDGLDCNRTIEHHRKRVRFFSTVELVNALEQKRPKARLERSQRCW